MDEFLLLSTKTSLNYQDFLNIPIFQRRYLVNKIIEINTPKE
jgi:hypothetical protein